MDTAYCGDAVVGIIAQGLFLGCCHYLGGWLRFVADECTVISMHSVDRYPMSYLASDKTRILSLKALQAVTSTNDANFDAVI